MRFKLPLLILVVLVLTLGVAWAQDAPEVSADAEPVKAEQRALAAKIAVITLHGDIDAILPKTLKRRIELALEDGADLIMFEIDTYGGRLDAAIEIGDQINDVKVRTDGKTRTVAYVHKKAISAGALIALSAQEIVMRHATRIGDCQAIMVDPQKHTFEVAPEKVQTNVRAVVRTYAESNGYPVAVCEAMVDQELEVYKVTLSKGEVRYLTTDQIDRMKAYEKGGMKKEIVVAEGKLLTMSAKEAERWDVSSATVNSYDAAVARYAAQGAEVLRYETNWSEEFVRFLNSMAVASVLMTVGIVALYMAFKTPGFGAAETVAIVCFATFFFSKYLTGLATAPEIVLFVVGVALLAVEIFLIPGFGIVGVLGILSIVASLVLSLQDFTVPRYDFQIGLMLRNVFVVLLSLFIATGVFMVVIRLIPYTPVLSRLVLRTTEGVAAGYVVGSAESKADLAGKTGLALTSLRPAGRAEIDGAVMSVTTDGEFLEAGQKLEVVEVESNRVLVRKAQGVG